MAAGRSILIILSASETSFRPYRREQQLVEIMERGLTNKEIAVQLNLSEQTIKNHVHRVLQKVGAGIASKQSNSVAWPTHLASHEYVLEKIPVPFGTLRPRSPSTPWDWECHSPSLNLKPLSIK